MGLVIGTGGLHIGTSGGSASPVKRFDAEAEYIKRKAGGTDNIGTGKAKIPTLKGKSVVWNQFTPFLSSENWSNESGTTSSFSDGVANVSNTTAKNGIRTSDNRTWLSSHKYYLSTCFKFAGSLSIKFGCIDNSTNVQINGTVTSNNEWVRMSKIASPVNNGNSRIYYYANTANASYSVKNGILIDLTQMFGAGNEPSTVEEFEAMYPLPYYEYNAGEIINNAAEAIETVGFNQWDEEWESGSYRADGQPTSTVQYIRSTNFIPVFPNTEYCNVRPSSQFYVCEYDASKEFIRRVTIAGMATTQNIFTTGDGVFFIKFCVGGSSTPISTYNNDICINLSDPAKNGTYKPYEKHTLQLGLNSFNVKDSGGNIITVNGLKSAGSAYDEIDLTRGKYIKRIGSVDLGELTLNYQAVSSAYPYGYFTSTLEGGTTRAGRYLLCERYAYKSSGWDADKIIRPGDGGSNRFYVIDSAYTDVATFKTAMSGVMLYYELATPIEYDLVTPIGNSYKVISGGTEERLPRDTASSVMAPIKYSVKYVQPKD